MKWIITIILACLITGNSIEMPIGTVSTLDLVNLKKANFLLTYKKIRWEEGNYVNDSLDLGKETYGGVTAKYNPDWYGWRYISSKNLKYNQYVAEAEPWVLDYYVTIWVREGFYRLSNQEVANYLFDTRVHLSRKQTIRLINRAYNLSLDENNEDWITLQLSRLNLTPLREERINYYKWLINKIPTQKKWWKNWQARAMR